MQWGKGARGRAPVILKKAALHQDNQTALAILQKRIESHQLVFPIVEQLVASIRNPMISITR